MAQLLSMLILVFIIDGIHAETDRMKEIKVGYRLLCIPDVIYYTEKENIQMWKIFSAIKIKIASKSSAFQVKIYEESDILNDTLRESTKDFQSWLLTWMQPSAWYTSHNIRFSPFQKSYFKLNFYRFDQTECNVSAQFVYAEPQLLALFVCGLILVLFGPLLSRNIIFHYTSAVAIGMLASWIVALFILCRFIPFKRTATALLVLGSSFGLFVFQRLADNFLDLVQNHLKLFISYCAVVGCLTFATVYYFGPIKSPKTFNLLQWFLQGIGLILLYYSTQVVEVSVTLVVVAIVMSICLQYFHVGTQLQRLLNAFIPWSWYYWLYYKKPRFVTEEEYQEQAIKTTAEALEELRHFSSSPGCDSWRYVSRLKDPKRFANFIATGVEFLPEEVLEYEKYETNPATSPWYSDDDDSMMEIDAEEMESSFDQSRTFSF